MRSSSTFTLLVVLMLLAAASVTPAEVAVTVYNQDLGLVREVREFDFPRGVGELRFVDVASKIIPTSVHFSSEAAALLEQNYEYDLVDARKLTSRYLDREVELTLEDKGFYLGTLLSASGDVVIRERDGSIRSISRDRVVNVHYPDLPQGLITRPTLVWMVESAKGGKGKGEISYLTNGMSWEAEYVAVTDKDDKAISLTGWVNITNNSGATYRDARIKLMAGDVQVLREKRGRGARDMVYAEAAMAAAPQFEEQPFYEYHLYTLQRQATIGDNQTKQISLFPTASVRKVEKEYRYDPREQRWGGEGGKVKVTLIFENSEANGLGMPLPKGKVRVYKEGPDGGLEFVGEDMIDHTTRNETVKVSTGKAFDIVGERRELEVTRGGRERQVEIKVRNRKEESVEVVVAEHLYGDWTMLEATSGWEKKRADMIEWKVKLAPDEEKVLTYRVLFNW